MMDGVSHKKVDENEVNWNSKFEELNPEHLPTLDKFLEKPTISKTSNWQVQTSVGMSSEPPELKDKISQRSWSLTVDNLASSFSNLEPRSTVKVTPDKQLVPSPISSEPPSKPIAEPSPSSSALPELSKSGLLTKKLLVEQELSAPEAAIVPVKNLTTFTGPATSEPTIKSPSDIRVSTVRESHVEGKNALFFTQN